MSTASEPVAVLSFEEAAVDVPVAGFGWLALEATLRAGELWLVQAGDEALGQTLIDAATGMTKPRRGTVRFLGHDWQHVPDTFGDALRGRIGLISRRGFLLPYAGLAASTLITARFHRTDDDRTLIGAADDLARQFGLPGLAADRAVRETSLDVLRAACVRAFLGEPSLVLVESRPLPWTPDFLQPLIDAMQTVRERGGGVIWCVEDDPLFDDPTVPATGRLRFRGRALERIDA